MTVAVPIVSSWDGLNRRIILKQGVSDYFPIEDLYAEYRNERRTNELFRIWDALLRAEGNIPKGGGAFTPRYVVLLDGAKIVPYNETLQINQLGDIITDDPDTDPTLYDISGLTVAKPIFIKPSEAETIQLNNDSIVFSSFQGAVWYDVNSLYGDKGTGSQPNGNTERPVNDLNLVEEILAERGLNDVRLQSNTTIGAGIDFNHKIIHGLSHVFTNVVIEDAAAVDHATIIECVISGIMDGDTSLRNCVVNDITYLNGHIHDCALNGNIILGGNKDAYINNCTQLNINVMPNIDIGGAGQDLVMPNYVGAVSLSNLTGDNKIGIGVKGGQVNLDLTTITAGTIHVSGTGSVKDLATNEFLPSGTYNGMTLINETSEADIELEYSGVIYIDFTGEGTAGTADHVGTIAIPSSNLADAVLIGAKFNINSYHIAGTLVLDQDVSGFEFTSWKNGKIDLNNQLCEATRFREVKIYGICASLGLFFDCRVDTISNINGNFYRCYFLDTTPITVAVGATVMLDNCRSQIPGILSPVFDFSAGNISFNCRAYSGGIKIINSTDPNNVSTFEFIAGKMNMDASDTSGQFHVRGVVDCGGIDISVVDATIYDNGSLCRAKISDAVLDEIISEHTINGSLGKFISDILVESELVRKHVRNKSIANADKTHFDIYDDDDITVVDTIDISEDGLTRN